MKHLKSFNESYQEKEIVFTNKNNSNLVIMIKKAPDGKITAIVNKANVRFPFQIGQSFTQNINTWACNNNFLIDGEDPCPEKKVFGIRTKDIPKGHELRMMYPSKFK